MYTLSMIFNLHNEGELAEKTIKNLRNILHTTHNWEDIEIVVVLDNPDEKTKNIVYRNSDLFQKIEEVKYKDLGDSRNHGISCATNEFITFVDGDDYFTHNFLEEIYKVFSGHYRHIAAAPNKLKYLSDDEHVVVFPQYYIEFPKLLRADYYESTGFTIQNNKFVHCFGSRISLYRGLLIKYKVNSNKTPYGYEDWDLNNRLLSNGVQFKISKHKLYYRRENSESLLAMQVKNKNIVRNSSLYDSNMININPKVKEATNKKKIPESLKSFIWNKNAKSNLLKKIYSEFINREKQTVVDALAEEESVFNEDILFLEDYGETVSMREDIQIYSLEYFSKNLSVQTKIYAQLMEFFRDKEMVYFFPWVVVGGADKVSVEYTKALASKNSCVITSISSGVRINNITLPHLDLVSGVEGWESISEEDQLHILIKAIINSKIKLVHIVNSEIALKTVKYYERMYKEYNVKTIVSLFCPEYHWENKEWHGFPVMYPELFKNADLILLDNHYWYDFFKTLNNNNDFIYKKLSSPTDKVDISYKIKKDNTKKILWASRICNQKLFEVFEEIVNLAPEYNFIIYGSVVDGDIYNQEILDRLIKKENIEFRGEYEHISQIDLNEFDLYLFTSLYEGIPTTILDMVMAGIPIVTADVGGISEILGKDYQLLVENESVATDYTMKIKEFYINKECVLKQVLDARNIIIDEYNQNIFQKEYANIVNSMLPQENKTTIGYDHYNSLGYNCEVGMYLVSQGIDDSSFFRYTYSSAQTTLNIIKNDFKDIFLFENLIPTSDNMIKDIKYEIWFHSDLVSHIDVNSNQRVFSLSKENQQVIYKREKEKIDYLLYKEKRQMEENKKILYLIKDSTKLDMSYLEELIMHIKALGNNNFDVLYLALKEWEHEFEKITNKPSNLIIEYLDFYAPEADVTQCDEASYEKILQKIGT